MDRAAPTPAVPRMRGTTALVSTRTVAPALVAAATTALSPLVASALAATVTTLLSAGPSTAATAAAVSPARQ